MTLQEGTHYKPSTTGCMPLKWYYDRVLYQCIGYQLLMPMSLLYLFSALPARCALPVVVLAGYRDPGDPPGGVFMLKNHTSCFARLLRFERLCSVRFSHEISVMLSVRTTSRHGTSVAFVAA